MLTKTNALRLADQTILQLRRNRYTRAVWLIGSEIARTPNTDDEAAYMLKAGAALVGVFGPDIQRKDLAEAIMEVASERQLS